MAVSVDVSGVAAKIASLMRNKSLGLHMASEAIGGMDQYVPFREGNLSRSAQPSPFKVTYTEDYAKRVYEGVGLNFSTEHHALATAYWDKEWYVAHGDEYERSIEGFIRTRL